MGYGEWVGNQSVHFKVVYEDKDGRETGSVSGRDPISLTSVGTNKRRKLTRSTVRVQLRYATLPGVLVTASTFSPPGSNFLP